MFYKSIVWKMSANIINSSPLKLTELFINKTLREAERWQRDALWPPPESNPGSIDFVSCKFPASFLQVSCKFLARALLTQMREAIKYDDDQD